MSTLKTPIFLLPFLLDLVLTLTNSLTLVTPPPPPLASRLTATSLSQSYPPSLLRKLFSSLPERAYAVQNITLTFSDEITLLVGASASGKSCLLRLLAGEEAPLEGTVVVNGGGEEDENDDVFVRPVIVERRRLEYDDSTSVWSQLMRNEIGDDVVRDQRDVLLARELVEMLGLETAVYLKPSQLSSSELFLSRIVGACLQSVSGSCGSSSSSFRQCPILLLDELLDFEHVDIVRRVAERLKRLVDWGGVVIVATHKPQGWENVRGRVVTLSGGKVLKDERRVFA